MKPAPPFRKAIRLGIAMAALLMLGGCMVGPKYSGLRFP